MTARGVFNLRLNTRSPLPVIEDLLAATARVHGLSLVTRNPGCPYRGMQQRR